jgi:glucokinase
MSRLAIGIDLGGTNIKGVVMDESGTCRHITRVPTEADKGGVQVLDNILSLIGILLEKEGASGSICGVGLGTPGFVDDNGVMIGGCANLPGWCGTDIYGSIKKRFGLKARAANDVTSAAYGEYRFGAGIGVHNMVCLAMGTGIGGGIVINNQLYAGTHGMAGELGHIVVETNGLQCNCGLKGCVEQYASANGVAAMARRMAVEAGISSPFGDKVIANPDAITSKDVYEYVAHNDMLAKSVHETACDMLARACGIICNAFAPDRIVLGGGLLKAGEIIVNEVKNRIPLYCWKDIANRCEVVSAKLSEDAGVMGAAAMVFE